MPKINDMKKLFFSFLLLLSTLSLGAQIYDFDVSIEPVYFLQNGTLYEYVMAYDSSSNTIVKMSELDWNLTQLSYLGGRASLDWKYFNIEAEITSNIKKNSGLMIDYDWQDYTVKDNLYYYSDPLMNTDKSISENSVNSSTFMNVKIQGNIPIIFNILTRPYIGAEYHAIKFSANKGFGWYGSSLHVPYTDENAIFYDKGSLYGIDYDRNTFSIYLGLSLAYSIFNRINVLTYASISPYTLVESLDFHHSNSSGTSGTFYNDIMQGFFKEWRFGAAIECNVWSSLFIDTSLDFLVQKDIYGVTYTSSSKNMRSKRRTSTTSACAGQYWNLKVGLRWTF